MASSVFDSHLLQRDPTCAYKAAVNPLSLESKVWTGVGIVAAVKLSLKLSPGAETG